jgi:hypothetical protein
MGLKKIAGYLWVIFLLCCAFSVLNSGLSYSTSYLHDHFTLTFDPQGSLGANMAPSHMATRKIIADVRASRFPGEHDFVFSPYIHISNPHGGNMIGWTTANETRYTPSEGSLEYGKGCEVYLAFSDIPHSKDRKLVGIGKFTEDGFGPVQRFEPFDPPPGVYKLIETRHSDSASCILEFSENHEVRFGVFVSDTPRVYFP